MSDRLSRIGSVGAVVVATAAAWLLPAVAAGAQQAPFAAVVQADKTPVYAGGGPTYYHVGHLDKGARVQVEEVVFEWFKVAAPPGVFSYVSKAFVTPAADGKSGQINADRTMVKAAALTGPGDSARRQLELSKGATVQIVGEESGYYKIAPPAGAFVYLAPGSLGAAVSAPAAALASPATPAAAPVAAAPAAAAVAAPVAPAPTAEAAPAPALASPATQPAAAAGPAPSAAETAAKALLETEALMESVLQKPLEEQPLEAMLSAYQALANREGLSLRQQQQIQARIMQVKRNQELAAGVKEMARTRTDLAAAAAELAKRDAELKAQVEQAKRTSPRAYYDAVGQLMASTVYDGQRLPRLYRLVDPVTSSTTAYIQPTSEVDPQAYLGRIVGIVGSSRFEPAITIRIITAKSVEVLSAAE